MRHGEYIARIEYDPEIEMFMGVVVNTSDVITFYGDSVEVLKNEFAASLEAHQEFCRSKGIVPSRPFSGKFNLRLSPEAHARVSAAAAISGKTMNAWIAEIIERAAKETTGDAA